MKKTIFTSALIITVILLFASIISSCANSDDYIYNEDIHTEITITAQMAKSFDSTAVNKRSDTIAVGDSMIFMAKVYPSKSIRIKESYWEMDNQRFASEFNVRDAITLPGHHEFVFVLIDFFGDTLKDTVNLWVADLPILKATNIIPANKSQGISPNKDIQFVWNAISPDSSKLKYHFTLTNAINHSSKPIIDTIISNHYFICNKELDPLSVYQWSVIAINEFNLQSKNIIINEFSTHGVKDESGIFGYLKTSAPYLYADVDIITLDSNNKPIGTPTTIEMENVRKAFYINPLNPGNYKITAYCKKCKDFIADTIPIKIKAQEVTQLDSLNFIDSKSPSIHSLSNSDTIDFADTLSFIIQDGDCSNILPNTIIYLGNRKITERIENKNTISFATIEDDKTWTTQLVTIIAEDASGNKVKKDFYIRPAIHWLEANKDTTISKDGFIRVFIKDINPYHFTPTLYKINPFNDKLSTLQYEAEWYPNGVEDTILGSKFPLKKNVIVDSVIYDNSISTTHTWTITINNPPEMDITHCIDPCNIQAGTSAFFEWKPAFDSEGDSLLYRVIYTLSKDALENDTSQFIYPMPYSKKTYITLSNLPIGPIYWWVEAKDPYGGTSKMWEKKARTIIYNDNQQTNANHDENTEGDNEP